MVEWRDDRDVASAGSRLIQLMTLGAVDLDRRAAAREEAAREEAAREAVIDRMVSIIKQHLDQTSAERLAALPEDPRVHGARRKGLWAQPGQPSWAALANAVVQVAREQDPGSTVSKFPDRNSYSAGASLREPWRAALFAACDAATAQLWPDRLTADERKVMIERWEVDPSLSLADPRSLSG
jgi:hypothetical protein